MAAAPSSKELFKTLSNYYPSFELPPPKSDQSPVAEIVMVSTSGSNKKPEADQNETLMKIVHVTKVHLYASSANKFLNYTFDCIELITKETENLFGFAAEINPHDLVNPITTHDFSRIQKIVSIKLFANEEERIQMINLLVRAAIRVNVLADLITSYAFDVPLKLEDFLSRNSPDECLLSDGMDSDSVGPLEPEDMIPFDEEEEISDSSDSRRSPMSCNSDNSSDS